MYCETVRLSDWQTGRLSDCQQSVLPILYYSDTVYEGISVVPYIVIIYRPILEFLIE